MNVDASTAYGYASRIAKPRLVGTIGELETRQYIVKTLKSLGYVVKESPFYFYPGFSFAYLKLSLVVIVAFLLIQHLMLFEHPTAATILGFFIPATALVLMKRWRFYARDKQVDHSLRYPTWRKRNPAIGYKMRSVNIETVLAEPENPAATIYLLAHYDSKSQNISIALRIACTAVIYYGLTALPLLYLAALVRPDLWANRLFSMWTMYSFLGTMVAGLTLALMSVENRSSGAMDNAASCGLLLGLADAWRNRTKGSFLDQLEIHMVFTGAEEVGLAGAEALVIQNRDAWRSKKVLFLNLDGVGTSRNHSITSETALFSKMRRISAPLLSTVLEAARKQQIPLYHLKGILGGEADHMPLVQAGFPAITLGSYSRRSLAVHTSRDTLEKIDLDALDATGKLVWQVLHDLANLSSASDR